MSAQKKEGDAKEESDLKSPSPTVASASPNKRGHHLPQIPSMTSTRVAVSKASRKEEKSSDADNQFVNIVPLETVETSNDSSKEKTPQEGETPVKDDVKPPSSLPTPPSDKASEGSPKQITPTNSPSKVDKKSGSLSPPIKLKISRTSEGKGNLTSSVSEAPDHENTADKSKGPARTKENIKKKLMKKKQQAQTDIPVSNIQEPSTAPSSSSSKYITKAKAMIDPLENEIPSKYLVGDMVWSKVSGHPWWPSMVSYDPFTSKYTQVKNAERKNRSYHVQFFGNEGERGWINDSSMIQNEGRKKFDEWCGEKLKTTKGRDRLKYTVPATRRPAWEIAVKSAEEALPLSINERRQQYTFEYIIPGQNQEAASAAAESKAAKKRKLSTDGKEDDDGGLPPKKKRRRSKSKGGDSNKSVLADQSVAQYMVFCMKRKEQIRREHPGYSEKQIEKALKDQWDVLSDEDKSKFIPMGADVKHISDIIDETGMKRTPKPSKKRQEMGDAGAKVKRNISKSSLGSALANRSQEIILPPITLPASVEEIINAVAAGEGDIWTPGTDTPDELFNILTEADMEMESGATSAISMKEKKNKADDIDETSSQASSFKDDASTSSRSKKLTLAQLVQPDGCEPDGFEIELFRLSASSSIKKENICIICEQSGELITCEGPCFGSYHLACLGLTVAPPGSFKCDECVTGRHTCFVCKKSGSDTRRCTVNLCGRFYHDACLDKYPLAERDRGTLHCPLHTCATCAAISPQNSKNNKGRLFKCVRCPTAYHTGDFCIAAGSMHLAGYHIVCSKHFVPVKATSHHSRITVSWCFLCSKGGTLLCCDACPAAFHTSCLKIEQPEGEWLCSDCRLGKRPLYGDIIWVKLGSYRWWPGEICHPLNVPLNIQDKSHQVGEFPIHFFGSHDYFWTHMGRVFSFQEGDKGSNESASAKGLVKVYQKAVQEATRAFQLYKKAQEVKQKMEQDRTEKKPEKYKLIRTNTPIGNVVVNKAILSEIPRCECDPTSEAPCSGDTDCVNRMMMYECHPAVCAAAEKCQNQRFMKRQYPDAVALKSDDGCGWGLKTLFNIKKGEFVNEYVGDLIDEEECKRRIKQAHEDNITNFYMLTMDSNRVIDAGPKGNYSRFMNHSCDPNCETQKWTVNGDLRIGLFACKDIPSGSWLTFNYNLECRGDEKTVCKCGAEICSGYLGVPPKTQAASELEKKQKKKKKHKKKAEPKKTEDDCYRCGDGGELVICDRKDCPKAYHLECLTISKLPHGQWVCPWHHCDGCGKRAVKLCMECPNSFCPLHIEGNIFATSDERLICHEHAELLDAVEASKLPNEPVKSNGSASDTMSSCESQTASDSEETSGTEADNKVTSSVSDSSLLLMVENKTDYQGEPRDSSVTVIDTNGLNGLPLVESKPKPDTVVPLKKQSRARKSELTDESKVEDVGSLNGKDGGADSVQDKDRFKSPKASVSKDPTTVETSVETSPVVTTGSKSSRKNKRNRSSQRSSSKKDKLSQSVSEDKKASPKKRSSKKKTKREETLDSSRDEAVVSKKRSRSRSSAKQAAAKAATTAPENKVDSVSTPPVSSALFDDDSEEGDLVIDL